MRHIIITLIPAMLFAGSLQKAGPTPDKAQIDRAVSAWVISANVTHPAKLVVGNVHLVGVRGWRRDWSANTLRGKGADAFPQTVTYDYGWEVGFTTTSTSNDGRVSRDVQQSVLILDGSAPRARITIK